MLNVKKLSDKDWDEAMRQWPESNFLQNSNWRKANLKTGRKVEAIAVENKDKEIVALVSIIVQSAKRGRYGEIAGGPLMDWSDSNLVKFVFENIKNKAKEHKMVFVRIRPQVVIGELGSILVDNGLKKSPMHLHAEHTNILNLDQSEDYILSHMRRQTRYEIKKSKRLEIEISSDIAREDIESFIELQSETAKRQGFVTSSPAFLRNIAEEFGANARIYTSKKGNKVLNKALILFSNQEVDYFEAASSLESYKLPGSYGLVWNVIEHSKQEGFKRLNLWGISYSNNSNNRYAGVTTFKRGFGGEDVTYEPAHDLVLNPIRYSTNWLIETVRRKKRRL